MTSFIPQPSTLLIMLICSDMSPQTDMFNHVIDHFGADSEGVRSAAAFAAGKILIHPKYPPSDRLFQVILRSGT